MTHILRKNSVIVMKFLYVVRHLQKKESNLVISVVSGQLCLGMAKACRESRSALSLKMSIDCFDFLHAV